MSMPRATLKNGPVTQRGRSNKLGDSQQYNPIKTIGGPSGSLLNAKTNLRQAFSVHKVERGAYGVGNDSSAFNPNRTDSFTANTDDFGDEVVGRAFMQPPNAGNGNKRGHLFT